MLWNSLPLNMITKRINCSCGKCVEIEKFFALPTACNSNCLTEDEKAINVKGKKMVGFSWWGLKWNELSQNESEFCCLTSYKFNLTRSYTAKSYLRREKQIADLKSIIYQSTDKMILYWKIHFLKLKLVLISSGSF